MGSIFNKDGPNRGMLNPPRDEDGNIIQPRRPPKSKLGRWRTTDVAAVRRLYREGKNQTEIAKELNISQATVFRYVKEMQERST